MVMILVSKTRQGKMSCGVMGRRLVGGIVKVHSFVLDTAMLVVEH